MNDCPILLPRYRGVSKGTCIHHVHFETHSEAVLQDKEHKFTIPNLDINLDSIKSAVLIFS
jgi:hypothetical protein